ncbi:MAG: GTP cyclohydrolase II [Deltaproteobacteria bacterium]|jgi:GTP cyclohydrolase II|nr:GTP cyclohydrolase II [Deltaproteobacteria bacterium]MBW2535644.1 GTP cyclohydrolase II [Deltaproteobacteria bacterium]
MFSYIDKKIHRLLRETDKIRTVGDDGHRRLSLIGPVPIPVADPDTGDERLLRWYPFVRRTELEEVDRISADLREGRSNDLIHLINSFMCVNSLLVYGELEQQERPLVRIHSCCMTGDVFGSQRCECGPQLRLAYRRVFDEGAGAIVYMASHEGRGIGLWAKAVTYLLQDMGQDTYQANESLGLPADSRDFTDAALALGAFIRQDARVRLLTNNPMKQEHLERGGVAVAERVPLIAGISNHNLRYLHAKKTRGHDFGSLGLPSKAPPPEEK